MSFRHTLVVLEKEANTIQIIRELAEAVNLVPYFILGERKATTHFAKSEIAAIILNVDIPLKNPVQFVEQFADYDTKQKKWSIPVLLIHTTHESRVLADYPAFEPAKKIRKPLIMGDLCSFFEQGLEAGWNPEVENWRKKLEYYQSELIELSTWAESLNPLIDYFEG